jgi:hypothetical protein
MWRVWTARRCRQGRASMRCQLLCVQMAWLGVGGGGGKAGGGEEDEGAKQGGRGGKATQHSTAQVGSPPPVRLARSRPSLAARGSQFTGGALTAVRPEDEPKDPELEVPLSLESRVGSILQR